MESITNKIRLTPVRVLFRPFNLVQFMSYIVFTLCFLLFLIIFCDFSFIFPLNCWMICAFCSWELILLLVPSDMWDLFLFLVLLFINYVGYVTQDRHQLSCSCFCCCFLVVNKFQSSCINCVCALFINPVIDYCFLLLTQFLAAIYF